MKRSDEKQEDGKVATVPACCIGYKYQKRKDENYYFESAMLVKNLKLISGYRNEIPILIVYN